MESVSYYFEQQDIAIFKAMVLMNLHKDGNKSEGVHLLQLLQKNVVSCTEENSHYENSANCTRISSGWMDFQSVPARNKGIIFLLHITEGNTVHWSEDLGSAGEENYSSKMSYLLRKMITVNKFHISHQIYSASYKLNIHFNTQVFPCIKGFPWTVFCCYCGIMVKLFLSILCNWIGSNYSVSKVIHIVMK